MDPVSIAAIGWSINAAGWIISPIISKFINRCCPYLGFDASKKLKKLGAKVLLLERVMEVVEDNPYKDRLQELCKDLKSTLYEAEDILDDIEYHCLERKVRGDKLNSNEAASRSKKNSLVKKVQSPMLSSLRNYQSGMSKSRLKDCFEKIEKVINDACGILEQLNLPSVANSDGRQVSAANSLSGVTTADPPLKVIGQDEERDKIIAMLHEKEYDGQQNPNSDVYYSIIGIHGVAGSGKSTLAQYICAHEKKDKYEGKDGHFDFVIWIHVSQKFELDAIFRDMLEGATRKACPQFNSRSALVEDLKDKRHGKRIFLVLDDVWYSIQNDGWHRLAELEQLLSPLKVGMTGSKILVTSRTKDALLALGAVGERCLPISDLSDEVFHQMFKHYAFRGVRVDGHDKIKLEIIGDKIAKQLNRSPLAARTVGSQLCLRPDVDFWRMTRDQDLLKETKGALWWSYRHLDEHVRRCFAYCSIFPRRYRLEREKLVRLWVAEGFIRTTNDKDELEAIGKVYFDELLSASFLQLGGKHWVVDTVEYFTVHDLLRDLAEEIAGSDCFRIEEDRTGEVPQDVRHLFVEIYSREILMDKIFELQKLRTLIIANVTSKRIDEEVIEGMFKRLPKLRVLSVVAIKNLKLSFPESMCQLKHLRYFGFEVGAQSGIILPSVENKLQGRLQIHGLENVGSKDEAIEANLADKEQLTEPVLSWDNGSCGPKVQAEVLEALCPSECLEGLEIRGYNGLTYPNWMVCKQEGGPEHLQRLHLKNITLGPAPKLFEHFVHLHFLHLSGCNWEALPDSVEHLTQLGTLHICSFVNIRALPTLPPSLYEFRVESCNTAFMASCKTIGDPN